jgi:hypothetical protein
MPFSKVAEYRGGTVLDYEQQQVLTVRAKIVDVRR